MKSSIYRLAIWLLVTPAFGEVHILADFERNTRPFSGGVHEKKNPVAGKGSLRVDRGYVTMRGEQDWSKFDYVHVEVLNPGDKPVQLLVEIRDKDTRDYWSRVNLVHRIEPGQHTVSFPTAITVGEKSSRGRPLRKDAITHVIFNVGKSGLLIVDNLRLERVHTARVTFPGLRAFDFGPSGSPVMDGFTAHDREPYAASRGAGWVRSSLWKSHNVLHPESLTQDFICPMDGRFRVDVSNGLWRVHLNIDCPGGYWGEVPAFRERVVKANGKVVVRDTHDADSFTRWYFRNAETEDLPGVDPFAKYIEPAMPERTFEVEVTDGRIELEFEGVGFETSLTHLYLYPAREGKRGEAFAEWVLERRKAIFDQYFRPRKTERTGAPPPEKGYVVFSRGISHAVMPYDGPKGSEAVGEGGIRLRAALNERAACSLSVQAGEDLGGRVEVRIEDMPSDDFAVGWLDYRISRKNLEGTIYDVSPRYLRSGPAPIRKGLTRRFWITFAPRAAKPGLRQGHLVVSPAEGPKRSVHFEVEVLPFSLAPIDDVAVGPWGSGIDLPWLSDDPRTTEWNEAIFENALRTLRAAGCTTFSGRPRLGVNAWSGKVELDAERADAEMETIRRLGFKQMISSYGLTRIGYNLYAGVTEENARSRGFESAADFYRRVWRAVDVHAVEKNWLPVAWNLCDEPHKELLPKAIAVARAHADAAEGLSRTTFMGATYLQGGKRDDPRKPLVEALPVAVLNPHDKAAIETIQKAGNRFGFYNGANRWTMGRYMRMLVKKHDLALRLTWHFNNAAGDPYYALDCREDDYSWFHTDPRQGMIPSFHFLSEIQPGLNDYRYLATLEQVIERNKWNAGKQSEVALAQELLDGMLDLQPGKDRTPGRGFRGYARDRDSVVRAILNLSR